MDLMEWNISFELRCGLISFIIFYLRGRVLTPIKSPILTRDFLLTLPNSRCLDERLTAMLILLKLRKYGRFTLASSLEDPKHPWRIPRDFGMNFLHMIWSMLSFSWFCFYFLMDPSLGTVQLRAPTRQNNSGPRHLTKCSMPKRRSCQSCQSHGFLCFWRPLKAVKNRVCYIEKCPAQEEEGLKH